MFNKILVPVDGSECSFKAVKTAASLAQKFNSEVTLIHIVALPSYNPSYSPDLGMIPQRVLDDLEKEGHDLLQKAKGEFTAAVVKTIVRAGHPAVEIIEEARRGYDIVVIGSRGLGEIKGFVMGSVSDRVTHHASCAVLVIH